MSVQTTNQPAAIGTGFRAWLGALLNRLGQNMQQSMELRSRLDQLTALEAESDVAQVSRLLRPELAP